MTERLLSVVMTAPVVALLVLNAVPAAGQATNARAPAFEPARLPDGHPDLQGLWVKKDGSGFDPLRVGTLDGTTVGRGGGGGRGTPGFLRPGVPILPYTPAAAAEKKNRLDNHLYDDPEAHCHVPGVPRGTIPPVSRSRTAISQYGCTLPIVPTRFSGTNARTFTFSGGSSAITGRPAATHSPAR